MVGGLAQRAGIRNYSWPALCPRLPPISPLALHNALIINMPTPTLLTLGLPVTLPTLAAPVYPWLAASVCQWPRARGANGCGACPCGRRARRPGFLMGA